MLSQKFKVDGVQDVFSAFLAFKALKASDRSFTGSVWRYHGNPASPNRCESCEGFEGEVYRLQYPDELLDLFPYGEFVSDDVFMPNVHPNCKCAIIRE